MIDLSTCYLDLPLGSPLVASASPLCESVDNIRAMEDAGVAAVVLHSLFEEQLDVESIHLDRYLTHGAESYAEALHYFPDLTRYNLGPDAYLEHVRRAKEAVGIPIIGSLNGVSTGGWVEFARAMLYGPVRSADTQWRASLRRLHEHLIAPAQDARLLEGAERIVVVPHRELHYLPFAALLDSQDRFLVESSAVGYAPSASAWLALGDRPRRSPSRDGGPPACSGGCGWRPASRYAPASSFAAASEVG